MFLRNRRWLATAGLLAALLAVPAPSLAAGLWRPATDVPGAVVRAWSLLQRLGVVPRMPEARPVAVWEKLGVMIDPNGAVTTLNDEDSGSATTLQELEGSPAGSW